MTNPQPRPEIQAISPADWQQIWTSRKCLHCGAGTRRDTSVARIDRYTCDCCGFTAQYEYEYTAAGRAAACGYGWAAAPFGDGTRPAIYARQEYRCYYRDLNAEREWAAHVRLCEERGECPF
jgi:hypothetical protein